MARKTGLNKNCDSFMQSMERLALLADRILNTKKIMKHKEDQVEVAESLLLRVASHWEWFVEEHLTELVSRFPEKLPDFLDVTLEMPLNKDICSILTHANRLKGFRNMNELIAFANEVLPPGKNAFECISEDLRDYIDFVFKIRSHLSHANNGTRKAYEKGFSQRFGNRRFQEPGSLLSSYNGRYLKEVFRNFTAAAEMVKAMPENQWEVVDEDAIDMKNAA